MTDRSPESSILPRKEQSLKLRRYACLIGILATASLCRAEDGRWTSPSGGSWATPSNWADGSVANDWFYTADFSTLDLTSPATVSLNGARSISRMVFGDITPTHDWILATGSAGPLTLGPDPEISVNNRSVTVSAVLAGTFGLLKTGPGTLNLSAINTYSGITRVDGGTLQLSANSGGSGSLRTGELAIGPGAAVIASAANALGYSGTNWVRTLRIEGGSFTTTANGDQGWGLSVFLTGGSMLGSGSGARISAGGGTQFTTSASATPSVIGAPVVLREGNSSNLVNFGSEDGEAHPDLDVTGPISGTVAGRGIGKSGNGSVRFSGNSSITGPFTLASGPAIVTGTISASQLTVAVSATLEGTGVINAPVTVNGALSPGDRGTGTLRFGSSVALAASSTTRLELRKSGTSLEADRIQTTSSLSLGGTLDVTFTGDPPVPGDTFTLFTTSAIGGNFAAVNLPALPGGLRWDRSLLATQGRISVLKALQTLTFDPLPEATLGQIPAPLTATASSGLPVTFSSSNPAVATIDGNLLTLVGSGYSDITASQEGDANHLPAAVVVRLLAVNRANRESQTLTFAPLDPVALGTPPFTLQATTTSGLPVTYTSSNPAVATLQGGTLTPLGAGVTTITASQPGNTDYLPAAAIEHVLTVAGTPQTLTFLPPPRQTFGNLPLALTATASSGLPVTFGSSDPAVATISGNILTLVGPGTTTLTATQPGNLTFAAAPPVARELVVNPAGTHLAVSPRSIALTLRSGEKSSIPLTLENPGTGAIDWQLPVGDPGGTNASLEGALAAFLANQASLLATLPANVIPFSGGITGTSIPAGPDANGTFLPIGNCNQLESSLGGPLEYSDRLVRTSALLGPEGRYFTLKLPGLFLFGGDAGSEIPSLFRAAGNSSNTSYPEVLRFSLVHGNRNWLAFAVRRPGTTSYSIDNLMLVDDPLALHPVEVNPSLSYFGKRRIYYAMFVTPPGTVRSTATFEAIARGLLAAVSTVPPGVRTTPAAGNLPPASTAGSSLEIDALDWKPGSYPFLLDPRPGNPDPTARRIPVNVTVSDPALTFSTPVIRRANVLGGPVELYDLLPVSTTGSPQTWSARILGSHPWVSITQTSGTTPEPVRLRFDPALVPLSFGTRLGRFRATLEIDSPTARYQIPIVYTVDPIQIRKMISDPIRSVTYAANFGSYSGSLLAIEPNTGKILRVVPTGLGSSDLALDPSATRAYVINQGESTVTGIDLDSFQPIANVAIPGTPPAAGQGSWVFLQVAAGHGSRVFCTDSAGSPNLHMIDFDRGTLVASVQASSLPNANTSGGGFADLHYDAAERRLYFSRKTFSSGARLKISALDASNDSLPLIGEFPEGNVDTYSDAASQIHADLQGERFVFWSNAFTRPLGPASTVLIPPDSSTSSVAISLSAYGHLAATSTRVFDGRSGLTVANLPAGQYWGSAFTPDQSGLLLVGGSPAGFQYFPLPAAVRPPPIAIRPDPADGVAIEETATVLRWSPLAHVEGYRIYLGTDRAALAAATPGHPADRGIVTGSSFTLPAPLPPGSYFWRIDAIRNGLPITGTVTSFGVAPFRVTPGEIAITAPLAALSQSATLTPIDPEGAPVAWSVSSTVPWITFPQASGAAGTPLEVRLNPAGLAAGIHRGTIRISSGGLTIEVPASLELFAVTLTRLKPDPARPVIYGLQTGALNGKPGHIVAIDAPTGAYLRSFPLPRYSEDFAVHPLEDRLYVPTRFGNQITVIDLAAWTTLPTLTLDGWTKTGAIYPGRSGRILVDDDTFAPTLHLVDSATGGILSPITDGSSFSDNPLAVTTPDGSRIFRTAPGGIQPVDLSTDDPVAPAQVDIPGLAGNATHTIARSYDGSRTTINNLVLGPDLALQGYIPAEVHALDRSGQLALALDGLYWTDTGLKISTFTAGYTAISLSADNRHAVAWSGTLARPVSIAIAGLVTLPGPQPRPGAYLATRPESLSWSPVASATAYHVYLGTLQSTVTSAGTTSPLRLGTTGDTTFPIGSELPPGFRYFWRIDAVTPTGTLKGAIHYFDLPFPQAGPPILSPANANIGGSLATSPTGELATGGSGNIIVYQPDPASSTFQPVQVLRSPDDTSFSSEFGNSLGFGPGVIATGEPAASGNFDDPGKARVFKQSGTGAWFPDRTLTAPEPVDFDAYGGCVAFSSNQLLVGDAYGGRNQVTPYFQWPDWKPGPPLAPNPRVAEDEFGASIAMHGTRAIVGAPGQGFTKGSAFIFEYDPASRTWLQRARLLPSAGTNGDYAGGEVSVSGDHAVIGSGRFTSLFTDLRTVQVFRRNSATSWTQSATLNDPQPGAGSRDVYTEFGRKLLLQGDLLFISAPYATHNGKPGGIIHVYRRNGSTWELSAPIVSPDTFEGFGFGMAYENGILFVSGGSSTEFGAKARILTYRIDSPGNLKPRFVTDPPFQVVAGRPVEIPVTAVDPEAAALTFGSANLPAGLSLSVGANGSARIVGTTTAAVGSEHWLRIPVSDAGGAESVQTSLLRIVGPGEIPVIAALPPSLEIRAGEDLSIVPLVTGTAPFTWRWQRDQLDLPGRTGARLSIPWAGETDSGSYRVIVTNAAGTTTSTAVTVTVRPADRFAGDWTTTGSANDRDGHQAALLGKHRFALRWTSPMVANGGINPVAIAGGRAFATPEGRTDSLEARAFDLGSGALLWQHVFPAGGTVGHPAWHAGRLYVQSGNSGSDGQLWSLDAGNGSTLWNRPCFHQAHAVMIPVPADTGVFAPGQDFLYAFQPDGSQRFLHSLPNNRYWAPALSDGRLFTWIEDTFTEHDTATGDTLWSLERDTGLSPSSRTIPVVKGDLACLRHARDIVGIDLSLRGIRWTAPYEGSGMPAIFRDRVYVLTRNSVLVLSAADGSLLATLTTPAAQNDPLIGQPVVLNDHLIVSNYSRTWIHDLSTLALVQELPHGGNLSYSAGHLLLTDDDSQLRAYFANAAPVFTAEVPAEVRANDRADDFQVSLAGFANDADPADPQVWSIVSVSNPGLFRSLEIHPGSGDLSVIYNPWAAGSSEVVVAVTDSAGNVARTTLTFVVPPHAEPGLQVAATLTLNRQTGLYEHRITVTNAAAREVAGFDLTLTGLPDGVTVNNASARDGNTWSIHHRQPLAAGASVTLLVEYFAPTRGTVINPSVAVSLVAEPESDPVAGAAGLAVDRCEVMEDQSILIEFTSVPGSLYEIQYSNNTTDWKTSPVKVRAAGNHVQWIDRGPPRTDTPPSTKSSRFYRVREITAP